MLASGQVDDGSGIVWRDRVRSLTSLNSHDPLALTVVRFAVFVPVGLALGLLLRRRWALIGVVGISLALVAGKLFVADRHPRLGDADRLCAGRPRRPGAGRPLGAGSAGAVDGGAAVPERPRRS